MLSVPLSRAQAALAQPLPADPSRFQLHADGSPQRSAIEQFVAAAYHDAYGAELSHFLPLLLEMRAEADTQAVLGMRPGAMGVPMFLEHYLDQPVEQIIAGRVGAPVARSGIVEIGNLASVRRGASPLLFLITAAALESAGYRWLAFTATPQVEKLVTRLQYQPLTLGGVDPARLGDEITHWGSYYETRPKVMCVPLAEALLAARQSTTIETTLNSHAGIIHALAQRLREYRQHHALFERGAA